MILLIVIQDAFIEEVLDEQLKGTSAAGTHSSPVQDVVITTGLCLLEIEMLPGLVTTLYGEPITHLLIGTLQGGGLLSFHQTQNSSPKVTVVGTMVGAVVGLFFARMLGKALILVNGGLLIVLHVLRFG